MAAQQGIAPDGRARIRPPAGDANPLGVTTTGINIRDLYLLPRGSDPILQVDDPDGELVLASSRLLGSVATIRRLWTRLCDWLLGQRASYARETVSHPV